MLLIRISSKAAILIFIFCVLKPSYPAKQREQQSYYENDDDNYAAEQRLMWLCHG